MTSNDPQPRKSDHPVASSCHGPELLELGAASEETRGNIGLLEEWVGQIRPDWIDAG